MATLQTARHRSASIARTRLEQVRRDQAPTPPIAFDVPLDEDGDRPVPPVIAPEVIHKADSRSTGSSVASQPTVDPYDVIMRVANHYIGWELISVQHLPDRDVRIAWLVRSDDTDDPSVIIREGRAIRIIVDGMGDLKVQRPVRTPKKKSLIRWLRG